MRRALLFAAALVLFTCTSAFADGGSVNYTGDVTFTYVPGFSFSFTEPATLTSLDTTTTFNITEGATNLSFKNSEVQFVDAYDGGLFDVSFSYMGTSYILALFGDQSYSQSGKTYNLLTGNFPVAGGGIFADGVLLDVTTSANVTAKAVGTPEPEGLAMLGLGIAALLVLRKKQLGGAAV